MHPGINVVQQSTSLGATKHELQNMVLVHIFKSSAQSLADSKYMFVE